MMIRLALIAGFVFVLAAPAAAVPYWIAYEGNDYPENEGWERVYGDETGPEQGGSERSLDSGWLVLDSLRNHLIYDTYFFRRSLNPGPGETFVAEWRVDVVQNIGALPDTALAIARDGRGTLAFQFGTDYLRNRREDYVLPLTPGVPHAFRVESPDMLSYSLFIDGVFARTGQWDLESLNESYVAFGDSGLGGGITSIARWDYVRFGVVPEPLSVIQFGCCLAALFTRRRSHDKESCVATHRNCMRATGIGPARRQRMGRR
jgi:hypothetical protein